MKGFVYLSFLMVKIVFWIYRSSHGLHQFYSIYYMSSFRMTHKEKRNNPPENSPCFGSIMALCSQVLGTADASGFCIHRPGISNDGTQRSLLEQFVWDEGLLPIFFCKSIIATLVALFLKVHIGDTFVDRLRFSDLMELVRTSRRSWCRLQNLTDSANGCQWPIFQLLGIA